MYCKDEDIDISEAGIASENCENNFIKDESHSGIYYIQNNALKPCINGPKIKQDASETVDFKFELSSSIIPDPSWREHETSDINKLVQADCDEKKVNVIKVEKIDVTIENSKEANDDRRIGKEDNVNENEADSKLGLMLHHEVNIEKTESEVTEDDDIVYLNENDIGCESGSDHGNSLDSDAESFGHQNYNNCDVDSSPVVAEKLKILLKDFLIDSTTGAKIKLRDFSIPLIREDSSPAKRVNTSRPEMPTYPLMPLERYGNRKYHYRIGPDSDLGYYKSPACPFDTSRKRGIHQHVRRHAKMKPFQCSLCPVGCYSEKSYGRHLWEKHRPQIPNLSEKLSHLFVSCSVCDYSTMHSGSLTVHMSRHGSCQESEALECKQCNYKCFNKHNYAKHMYMRHTKRELQCDFCDRVTRDKATIANHMLNAHKKETENCRNIWKFTEIYNCTLCDYRCVDSYRLKVHNVKHNKKKLQPAYTCFKCNFTAAWKHTLVKHLEDHKAVKQFKCEHCPESFSTKPVLHTHLLNQHKQQIPNLDEFFGNKLYSCDVCEFKTVYGASYKDHMLTHKDPAETERYNCGICDFKTLHKASMRKHMKTHREEKDFKCDWCQDKSFHFKREFATHLLVHHKNDEAARKLFKSMNYKVYSCKLCPLEYIAHSRFKKHMFMAHNDMSYASELLKKLKLCPKCDFKTTPADLKAHMISHESERQYKYKYNCNLCQNRFMKKTTLESHIKKHKKILGPRPLKSDLASFKSNHEQYDSHSGDKMSV